MKFAGLMVMISRSQVAEHLVSREGSGFDPPVNYLRRRVKLNLRFLSFEELPRWRFKSDY